MDKTQISKWLRANSVGRKGAAALQTVTTKQVANGVKVAEPVAFEILLAMAAEGTAERHGGTDLATARWATPILVPAPVV